MNRLLINSISFMAILSGLALSAQADTFTQRTAFFENTPITETTSPSLLQELAADIPILKSQGVVFNTVDSTNKPYPQAGFEIDFEKSKFTEGTKALALQWQRARNYFAIQGQLQKCGIPTSARNLSQRISAAAATVKLPQMDCQSLMNDTDSTFKELEKTGKAFISSELEDAALFKTLEMSAAQYAYLQKRYPSPSKAPLCGDAACEPGISEALGKAMKEAASGVQLASISQVRDELNNRINAINSKLGQIKAQNKDSITNLEGALTHPIITPQVNDEFAQYANAYAQAVAAPDGDLLTTDASRSKMGKFRTLEKDGGSNKGVVTWPSHGAVDDSSVTTSVQQARSALLEQITMLNKLYREKKNIEGTDPKKPGYRDEAKNLNDLKKLVKDNPLAVGRALMEHPEGASEICSAITSINHDDVRTQTIDTAFRYTSIGVGAVLLVTGVGSAAGVALLGGAAAATAVGAGALVTIGAATATAGTVLGVGSAAYFGTRAYNHYSDYQDLERSVLSHTGDATTLQEANKALADYQDARHQAIVNGAMSAVDIGSLLVIAKSGTNAVEDLQLMKTVIADSQTATKDGKSVAGTMERISKLVDESAMGKGLRLFARGKENLRIGLLEKLSKMGPERLKQVFADALALSRKCGS